MPLRARRTRRTAGRLLLAALVAAGCGEPRSAPAPGPPAAASPAVPQCDDAGIDARGGREGTCAVGSVARTVADREGVLTIDGDASFRLLHVGRRRAGDRVLVTVALRVTNLGSDAFRWPAAPRQVALYVAGRLVPQRRLREGVPSSARLKPGAGGTVVATWRLPPRTAAALRRRGSAVVVVAPAESKYAVTSVDEADRIGVLRLWK